MYDYFLPPAIRNFVDSIFSPPLTFLRMARDYLDNVSLIASHGINLNNYFSFFGYLPSSMQGVINALLSSIILLAVLQLIKTIMRLYFAVKDGGKWW